MVRCLHTFGHREYYRSSPFFISKAPLCIVSVPLKTKPCWMHVPFVKGVKNVRSSCAFGMTREHSGKCGQVVVRLGSF